MHRKYNLSGRLQEGRKEHRDKRTSSFYLLEKRSNDVVSAVVRLTTDYSELHARAPKPRNGVGLMACTIPDAVSPI